MTAGREASKPASVGVVRKGAAIPREGSSP